MGREAGPDAPDPEGGGTPVGRRVVLGLIGLAALGVVVGERVNALVSGLDRVDPTGLSGLIPGGARFRYYSVAGPVATTSPDAYRLEVSGMVDRPTRLSLHDLAGLPQTSLTKDVQCVTGWRVPDVPWSGVRLADLLTHVGAQPRARAVLFGSADGVYSESLTMEQARRPDVLIATSMQGGPVTHEHGGPARLYVAPMYFYKSLKWLTSVTVTDRVVPGYWERLGYEVDAWVGRSNGRDDAPTS
jgi:DMSO/TMAO reductase YedYZ molybdopterin-dependent catalytic subunit